MAKVRGSEKKSKSDDDEEQRKKEAEKKSRQKRTASITHDIHTHTKKELLHRQCTSVVLHSQKSKQNGVFFWGERERQLAIILENLRVRPAVFVFFVVVVCFPLSFFFFFWECLRASTATQK